MKKKYTANGLRTLSKSGSLIFCNNCDKIVGSINRQGYRYINLTMTCSCNSAGMLEISRENSTSNPLERINRMPAEKDGLAVCKKCGNVMFGLIQGRVLSYAFYVECTCGEKYDIKPMFGKRLGETLRKINEK